MSLQLPEPISAYFSADKSKDGGLVAACFTRDAIVKDEGHTYKGVAAFKAWKVDVGSEFEYASEPIAMSSEGRKTEVTSRLVGNFQGSPVNLRFFFEVDGDKISSLEIIP